MQSNILSQMADPALRVLVVWVPFMDGNRTAINTTIFPDKRVTDFWDPQALSSQWLSQHVTHQFGPTWDYFLLFPARARWQAAPGPVLAQGGTVIGDSGTLLTAIRALLH